MSATIDTSPYRELLQNSRSSLEQIRARDPRLAEQIGHLVGAVDTKQPLANQPKLAGLLAKARLSEVADVAGLSGASLAALEAVATSVGDLKEELLTKLVSDGS